MNDQNLLGNVEIPVHTAMLTAPVTQPDRGFSLPDPAWLEQELAQVIDLLYEDMILNGSTNNNTALGARKTQPVGILYGAAAGNVESNSYPEVILSGTAPGYDYNTLINIQMALAPRYESPETCWIMQKRSTYTAINKIKDSQASAVHHGLFRFRHGRA